MSCSFDDGKCPCGPDDRNPDDSTVVSLSSCNRDMSHYLKSLGLASKKTRVGLLSETDIILNRAGKFDIEEATKPL